MKARVKELEAKLSVVKGDSAQVNAEYVNLTNSGNTLPMSPAPHLQVE